MARLFWCPSSPTIPTGIGAPFPAVRHPLIGVIHRALPYEFDVNAPQSRDGQIRRSDTIFLVVVGILSLIASAVTFHIGRQQNAAIIAAGDDEDAPRTPLPAGPRKYR